MIDLFGAPTLGKPRATSGARGSGPTSTSGTPCTGVAPGKARATPGTVHAVQSASAELRALREERDLLYLDLVQVTSERDAAKRAVDVLRPAVLAAKDRVAAHFEEWGPPPTALGPAASAPLYAALDAATSALAPHAKALADAERIRKAILARLKEINMELEA